MSRHGMGQGRVRMMSGQKGRPAGQAEEEKPRLGGLVEEKQYRILDMN